MARILVSLLVAVMVVVPCAIAMPTLAYANAIVASADVHHAAAADMETSPCEEPAHGVDNHCGASCQNWSTVHSLPVQLHAFLHNAYADWAILSVQSAVWHRTTDYSQSIARPPDTADTRASGFSAVFARTGRLHL